MGRYFVGSSADFPGFSIAMMIVFINNGGSFDSFRILLKSFKTQIRARLPKCLKNSG